MSKSVKKKLLLFIALLIYFAISKLISHHFANICAFLAMAVLWIQYIILKIKMKSYSSKLKKNISNEPALIKTVLTNPYCILKYFKDEKIVIIDNPKSRNKYLLRAFIIDKTNNVNIESCWLDICAFFDEYTYFDSLLSYVDNTIGRVNIMFLNSSKRSFTIEGMEEFLSQAVDYRPKSVVPSENTLAAKLNTVTKGQPVIVDFKDLKGYNSKNEPSCQNSENPEHVVDIKDLNLGKKIYVNYADAETIAILPGINIIKAKKIIRYRDINGLFKSKQDFLNVAGVKEHFAEIILDMITLVKYVAPPEESDNSYNGRTVDY